LNLFLLLFEGRGGGKGSSDCFLCAEDALPCPVLLINKTTKTVEKNAKYLFLKNGKKRGEEELRLGSL
jgi:hypothetical protein